jgi:hypothetical protein
VNVVAQRPLATRERFIASLAAALDESRGFAAGKLGVTERVLLSYPMVRARERDPRRVRVFELGLEYQALRLSGIFPARPEFLRRFCDVYAEAVRSLDFVGFVYGRQLDDELFRFHEPAGEPMNYLDQEPDRSIPADESRCWLPLLRGRRVLLAAPFAGLLKERATRETFEAVWQKTGKPWFEPASIDAVEFPYGYARTTHQRYATVLDLYAELRDEVGARAFDVALIAAGPLGVVLAADVKRRGAAAISLGGHLQVLFGVSGRRWRERPEWRRDYMNDAWIDMPARYRPDPAETDSDYW